MTLGKSFIDTFSNTMRQEKQPAQPILSNKTGINKKKSTALQQQIVGNIGSGGFANGFVQ